MRKFLIISVLGLFALCAPALCADISGNWEIKLEGPAGPETLKTKIKVDGENIILEGEHSIFGDFKGNGILKVNAIKMSIPFEGVQGPGHPDGATCTFKFEGTVEGNKMGGTKFYTVEGEVLEVEGPNTWTAEKK